MKHYLGAEVLQGALQIGNVLKVHPENEGECHAGAVAAIYGVDDSISVPQPQSRRRRADRLLRFFSLLCFDFNAAR